MLRANLDVVSDLVDAIKAGYLKDAYTAKLLRDQASSNAKIFLDSQGFLRHDGRIIVPDSDGLRLRVVQQRHDSLAAGHPGQRKTYHLVKRDYWWPQMKAFIQSFVASCDTCHRTKTPRHRPYGLLKSLPVPPFPFSSVSMDFIEALPSSHGYTAILVVVDRLTKLASFVPTNDKVTAEALADLYLSSVWRHHGLPDTIISDRGAEFNSRFWKSLARLLRIDQTFSTAYHPQTDGQTERVNQVLEQYLRVFSNYKQSDWSKLLPVAEFAYNNSIHATTGISPFFANKGYNPRLDFSPVPVVTNSPTAEKYVAQLADLHSMLREEIKLANERSAKHYDVHHMQAPSFAVGDKVWLSRRNIRTNRPTRKLDDRFLGPFLIKEKISSHAYRLDLPASMSKIHNVFSVNLLEPYAENAIPGRIQPPPGPIEVDGDQEYEVALILDSKLDKRYKPSLRYLVSWEGYTGPDSMTWEPPSSLSNCQDLVHQFHEQNPDKPHPAQSQPHNTFS